MSDDEKPAELQRTGEILESEVEEWIDTDDADSAPSEAKVDIAKRYSAAQLRIVRSTMDLSLYNLKQSLRDSNYINLKPPYQRRHRWDTKKQSRLIESLLLNIPIPPIFLFENDYNQYEIMDGRQRLEAIKGFLDNSYKLRGLEYWASLDGSQFGDLPPIIQRGLLRRTIQAVVLLAETARPEESEVDVRQALFNRLNTGGVNLNPQELRNALYPSKFNKMLISIAEWDTFRDTWRIPRFSPGERESVPKEVQNNALYKTMADCELVLRFFAIHETITESRTGPLRHLMDATMRKHLVDDDARIGELDSQYRHVLSFLSGAFGGRPFVLPTTGRPSRPAYDALMVASALAGVDKLVGQEAKVRAKYDAAVQDAGSYEVLVGRGNTIEAIKERVKLALGILSE